MKTRLISVCVVLAVLVSLMVVSAVNELSSHAEYHGSTIEPVPSIVAVNDITMKKAGGKFKYKKEDPSEAQQGWKIAGSAPTSKENFYGASNFNIEFKEAGQPATHQHSFSDPTGVIGKDGDRYKKKFFYYTSTRSSDHHFPSFGIFKAWIRDEKLFFMYIIKKANEGNMLMEMEDFDYIRNETSNTNKIVKTLNLEGAIQLGTEQHGTAFQSQYKAKKKGLKMKIEQ
jgi:hypothetical protein